MRLDGDKVEMRKKKKGEVIKLNYYQRYQREREREREMERQRAKSWELIISRCGRVDFDNGPYCYPRCVFVL